ncbi:hypothetical protein HZF05_20755 [Sphingomonas sp. CGMCC 1.13654]|uniref:Uncharacterized protein n=1 Tax=Sphingomonas chungangi TaxID=2683589 RepID=A0A838LCZ7_9SPHN|nr:hypothetical protein [Sphingomonas chungangi]MBA2936519.1 hypothetical protein [Sphingomonas chungangi]MVW55904.1 hypothetical protein [Sphingomonas chungangi]
MKKLLIFVLAAGAAVTTISPADARGGCGVGFHRGPYGGCRPNLGPGPVVVGPRAPVIGVYYGGRGYWDGSRYWGHRYRWHGGWRYR